MYVKVRLLYYFMKSQFLMQLKALLLMNVLNDVTAAPFLVFFKLVAEKKTPKTVQL